MLGCRHSLLRLSNISRFSQVECTFSNISTCEHLPVGGYYLVVLAFLFMITFNEINCYTFPLMDPLKFLFRMRCLNILDSRVEIWSPKSKVTISNRYGFTIYKHKYFTCLPIRPQSDIHCNRSATSPRPKFKTIAEVAEESQLGFAVGRRLVGDWSATGRRLIGDWLPTDWRLGSATGRRPRGTSLRLEATGRRPVGDRSPTSRRQVADRSPTKST